MTLHRKPFGVTIIMALACAASLFAARPASAALAATQGTDLWGGPGAKGAGVNATFDTNIYITSPAVATGTVDFYLGSTPAETLTFSVPARGLAVLKAPASVLGKGAFLFRVRSDVSVTVWSETYNDTPGGRFGASFSGFATSEFLNPGDEASGAGADASSSTDPGRARTNVGVLCSPNGFDPCTVEVAVFDGGSLLGTGQLSATPGSAAQQSLASLVPAAAERPNLSLRLRVLTGSAQPYVVRNDNQTSDAVSIPLAVARNSFSAAPVISSFTITPTTGCAPLQITATWATTGASYVTITNVAGSLAPSGSTTVNVLTSGDVVLTAYASSGAFTAMPRHLTLSPPTEAPAPQPTSAAVAPGGTVTGFLPFTADPVTITFDKQESGTSTFTLNGDQWTYVAGPTPGTDIVRLTVTGTCGSASGTFTATIVPPGEPAITSFTAEPAAGCFPAQIVLSWTTVNSTGVSSPQIPVPFTLSANGSYGVTIDATTTFTLTAFGTTPGETATAELTVPVDLAAFTPILDKTNVTVPANSVTIITVTGVPDLTLLRRVPVEVLSGGFLVGAGVPGQFSYLAGPIPTPTAPTPRPDTFRICYTNGCGPRCTFFFATVQ
jgi:hypothetical protein